jgi:general nucleoside transport system ATP-binding protein
VLAANGISKRFGRTLALSDVEFRAREGEIHALVGENGAGKSTLVNILAGRVRPDSGRVMLNGELMQACPATPALAGGIAAVYQSPMLFERMRWEENLALGGFSPQRFNLKLAAAAAEALAGELGFALPPAGAIVAERSVAERVRLEILRALSFQPRVLILDEPTSVLSPAELSSFLQLLRRLRSHGRIIILVTHKLSEALAVADRFTVLRHGRVVTEKNASETNEAELAHLMIGNFQIPCGEVAGSAHPATVLELHKVTLESAGRRALDGISLTLRAGAIIGIAGVDGNGQAELVEVMAGVRAPTSGFVRLHPPRGPILDEANSRRRRANSKNPVETLAVIPQNRDIEGLILDLSLAENLLLSRTLRKRLSSSHGWIRRSRSAQFCRELMERFSVRGGRDNAPANSLSGGNRQRFVVARALSAGPRAIVAHDICRGLDFSAAVELQSRLRDYAADGGAVLLISSDLEELLALCHRLYVIYRGRLREVPNHRPDPVEIGLLMTGAAC